MMMGLAAQTFMPSKAGGVAMRPGIGIDVDVAGGIDAAGGIEAVLLAGVEVVSAMRRARCGPRRCRYRR